jgi:hypothetical protein
MVAQLQRAKEVGVKDSAEETLCNWDNSSHSTIFPFDTKLG